MATLDDIDRKLDLILAALKGGGARPAAPTNGGDVSGGVFPNYGRAKGRPIAGASMGDLSFYANGCVKSLGNPDKAKYHASERKMLAAINAEIERQGGAATEEDGAGAFDGRGSGGDDWNGF